MKRDKVLSRKLRDTCSNIAVKFLQFGDVCRRIAGIRRGVGRISDNQSIADIAYLHDGILGVEPDVRIRALIRVE